MLCAGPLGEVGIENDVGRAAKALVIQIHQQKCQIIEDIAGAKRFAELQRVKKDGRAFHQHNVAQMQIAVAAPDMPRRATRVHLGPEGTEGAP